jgi:hypothetical protein
MMTGDCKVMVMQWLTPMMMMLKMMTMLLMQALPVP